MQEHNLIGYYVPNKKIDTWEPGKRDMIIYHKLLFVQSYKKMNLNVLRSIIKKTDIIKVLIQPWYDEDLLSEIKLRFPKLCIEETTLNNLSTYQSNCMAQQAKFDAICC